MYLGLGIALAMVPSIVLAGTLYLQGMGRRMRVEELETEYFEVLGERPQKPYERQGSRLLGKIIYDWPICSVNGKAPIEVYMSELLAAIEDRRSI